MKYIPRPFGGGDLALYVQEELAEIARVLDEDQHEVVNLNVTYAEPNKVYDGLVVIADGTSWNPGSGAGMYLYLGGGFSKL